MNNARRVIWGLAFIAAGIVFALNELNITSINLFFDGWWSLFLIVPCGIGLFTQREKTGNLIGLAIGVYLLLSAQGILDYDIAWKLLLPAIIVIVGLKMVFGELFNRKVKSVVVEMKANGTQPASGTAVFSGSDMNYANQVFEGAELNAVFGGIECDLREAVINKDCLIEANAIFGGIDILVPDNVNVKVTQTPIFGGASNKSKFRQENTVTLYVDATCIFGGVEIK